MPETQKAPPQPEGRGGVKSQEETVTVWKVRLCDGRLLTADYIVCEGGALLLALAKPDGYFLMVPPGRWVEATTEPEFIPIPSASPDIRPSD